MFGYAPRVAVPNTELLYHIVYLVN